LGGEKKQYANWSSLGAGLDTSQEPLAGGKWSLPHVVHPAYRSLWLENFDEGTIQDGHDWNTGAAYLRIPYYIFKGSGLYGSGPRDKDLVLYNRSACRQQIKFITQSIINDGNNGLIWGQPGSGKSSSTFFICCTLRHDYDIVWANIDRDGGYVNMVTIQENFMRRFTVDLDNFKLSWNCNSLNDENQRSPRVILIFDGFNVANPSHLKFVSAGRMWRERDHSNRRIIVVSSISNPSTNECSIPNNFMWHGVGGWNLNEYLVAVADEGLWDSVKDFFADIPDANGRVKLVEYKTYFAGTCARSMFGASMKDIIGKVERAIRGMTAEQIDTTLSGAIDSILYKHRLVSFTYDSPSDFKRTGFVSQYVARSIGMRSKSAQIIKLCKNCNFSTNPAAHGWIFEAVFLARASESTQVVVRRLGVGKKISRSPTVWDCPQPEHLRVVSIDPRTLDRQVPVNTWLQPNCPWNPGFDAVMLLSNGTIRFIQTTIGKSHDLKMWSLADFVKRLRELKHTVSMAEVFFVIPDDSLSRYFKIGKLPNWEDFSRLFSDWPKTLAGVEKRIQIAMIKFNDDS